MSEAAPPLLVFSDDWGRHPSSCQHLVKKLLGHRRVVWANTIGMRPPGFDWTTVRRGFDKLREWTKPSKSKATNTITNPFVISPRMWPSFRTRFTRSLNKRLLLRTLRPVIASLPAPPIVVTTIPIVADIVGEFPAVRWVYYCVDDFSEWPGLDGNTIREIERELVAKIDVAVAVSETLQTQIANLGKQAHLLTHGVELEHWRTHTAPLPDLAPVPRPLVVFWGVVDRRMDTAFVQRLGERMNAGTIFLVGPHDNPDPEFLTVSSRVRLLPAMAYDDLPALAAGADVLVMPYADLPVTRAMQPLKLKEYLATGKPVVVRDLPATRPLADCLDIADSPESFADRVLERLRTGVPASQQTARDSLLAAEGWDAKAAQFEKWLDGGI